ncbi:DUF1273 domain-containing protein [Pediococcus pentosaceus]|uniref:DUF1273 domain-containing protein n=1 Tax=Pediococcus pentosaceus TaxID=1255 RepID=UPI0018E1AFE7|nr:DUF1273 domain-containing protein [Pediococcus pentosaceus]MBF7103853.1 DUF1273 domain-containing protein [Pediococcus pentosaceus]QQC62086.1 DUF1273 domain-containing protein [Pediococcus pentosaceus]
MSRLWVTGYRSYELSIFSDQDPKLKVIQNALKRKLIEKVESGTTWVIAGPQLGTEQWALELANELKVDYPELQTALMFPFSDFGKQWKEEKVEKLALIKAKVDFFANVSENLYQNPQQLRNYQNFMLNHTDEALLLYDDEHAGKTKFDLNAIRSFQEHNSYNVETIDFYDLEEESMLYEEKDE